MLVGPLLTIPLAVLCHVLLSSRHNNNNNRMTKTSAAQSSVNDEWNAMASQWDTLAASYRDSLVQMLRDEIDDLASPKVIVDFGCGTGLLTESLRESASKILAIDAAPAMAQVLQNKIQQGNWTNVSASAVVLSTLDEAEESVRNEIESFRGKADLIVASSVMSFVPPDELEPTMKVLASLLKPGGIFCHSDFPQSKNFENGFTKDKAEAMYRMGGLTSRSIQERTIEMGTDRGQVLIGFAVKS